MRVSRACLACCVWLLSCTVDEGGSADPADDAGAAADGRVAPLDATAPSDGEAERDSGRAEGPECSVGERGCAGVSTERECRDVEGVARWVDTACDEHSYCVDDRCVPSCLDECALGDTRGSGGSRETCELYSADAASFVASPDGGHTLARRHLAWLRAHHLANGYVANTLFTSAAHDTPQQLTGTVDAAEWTGVLLAAESLRALTTHSPDAIRGVESAVERIHQLFEITGAPGNMARFWAPLGGDPLLSSLYDSGDWSHFAVEYRGGPAFYHGWTSRDMYAGVSLGLGLAYDATSSDVHRRMIREVVVGLARELIRDRRDVPVRVRYELLGSWQTTDLTFDMQHVVLVPNEMVDGRVLIQVGSEEDPSDYDASELRGVREFLPDFETVLGQTPGIGALLPSIPRPGSAIMLANLLELALHVTEGVPEAAEDRALVRAHYDAHQAEWLGIMRRYGEYESDDCWTRYFGFTIAHHPLYSILRLSDDAALVESLRTDVLAMRVRPFVDDHLNPYFDYIAASVGPPGLVPEETLRTVTGQLLRFRPPPKASIPVDNRGAYAASASCPGQSTTAVRIEDRVPQDFLWQHHPFRLTNAFVDPRHVFPGTDYLIAYWLGRFHGHIEDDAPRTCTRWR